MKPILQLSYPARMLSPLHTGVAVIPALLLTLAFTTGSARAQTTTTAPAPAAEPAQAQAQAEGPAADDFDPSDLTNPLSGLPAPEAPAPPPLPTDPDLPRPFDPSNVFAAFKSSPFNRAVNLSESLVLTGMAYVDGKPMATLLDKESKKTYVVTEVPNASGWTLTEATPTTDLKRLQVKVNVAGEVVTIRHDSESQQEAMKKHKTAPGGSGGGEGERRGGEDRGFSRDRRGPPPEAVERYNKLSDGAKEKLRKHFTENRERVMNMNPEERKAYMEKSFKKIADEDESSRK